MMQILDQEKEQRIVPLFRLGFRPFFLAASMLTVVSMGLWGLFWLGYTQASQWMYGNPIWWHSHEMLFGFTGAIIIGFLLTAVQNWTGAPGVRGWQLAGIFACWLVARIAMMIASPHWVWMAFDLLWMPLAAYCLGKPIVLRRQWNNLFFVPMLLLLTGVNAMFHMQVLGWLTVSTRSIALVAVMAISLVVLIVGGRVIPFFTWRGTQSEQITRVKWIEVSSLVSSWLVLLALLLVPFAGGWQHSMERQLLPVLLVVTAMLHLVRFARWRSLSTCRVPLLWLLHIAYLAMVIGLFMFAVYFAGGAVEYSIALHVLTVGGIGGMVLAMIARVSLGHTGRELKVGPVMVMAFWALVMALLARTLFIVMMPEMRIAGYGVSALLWALAYGVFSYVYYPVLTQPRVDGRPG